MTVKINKKNTGFMLEFGTGDHIHQALHHPDPDIRIAAVHHTNDMGHLDHLVHDSDDRVRQAVALRGKKQHLDHLVNDPHPDVRLRVAMNNRPEHLDKLMHDPHPDVRDEVAARGDISHHTHLMNDPVPDVRVSVAAHTRDHDVLMRMVNDPHESVVKRVIQSAHREGFTHINDRISSRVSNDPAYVHHKKHWLKDYARQFTD